MSTAKAPAKTRTVEITDDLAGMTKLFQEMLDRSDPSIQANAKTMQVRETLNHPRQLEIIATALPAQLKGEAERLVRRAIMTFDAKPELRDCPTNDFVRAVIRAAEMGLAIDGRLCHVVPFKGSWVVMPDYKGLVAVAKRSGQVVDVKADVVFEKDEFDYKHSDGKEHLWHRPAITLKVADRGPCVAAWACFTLTGGLIRYCVMSHDELEEIRRASSSEKGPWKTWPNEMRKKCPIRRGLKLYCDDPGVLAALEVEDEISTGELEKHPLPEGQSVDLSRKKDGNGKPPAPHTVPENVAGKGDAFEG